MRTFFAYTVPVSCLWYMSLAIELITVNVYFREIIFYSLTKFLLVLLYTYKVVSFCIDNYIYNFMLAGNSVIIQPSRSRAFISNGIAFISLLFSLTFSWPRETPLAEAQALTIRSDSKLPSHFSSRAPHISLPSIATSPRYLPHISRIYVRNPFSSSSGDRMENTRLNVSWEGTRLKSFMRELKNASCILPKSATSYQLSAPPMTAAIAI